MRGEDLGMEQRGGKVWKVIDWEKGGASNKNRRHSYAEMLGGGRERERDNPGLKPTFDLINN